VRDLAKPAHSRVRFRNRRKAPAEGSAATKLVVPAYQRLTRRRARVTWYVEVTTTSDFQARLWASEPSARASPRVLSGSGRKQMTSKLEVPLQRRFAPGHFGSSPFAITRAGAVSACISSSALVRRSPCPPASTTTASARVGESVSGQRRSLAVAAMRAIKPAASTVASVHAAFRARCILAYVRWRPITGPRGDANGRSPLTPAVSSTRLASSTGTRLVKRRGRDSNPRSA
jgi:hypothetical protein